MNTQLEVMTPNLRQKWQNIIKYWQKFSHKNLSPFAHNSISTKTHLNSVGLCILRTLLKTFAWRWRHNLLFHSFNRKHMKTNAIPIYHKTECKKPIPLSLPLTPCVQETQEMQTKDLNPFYYCYAMIDQVKPLPWVIYLKSIRICPFFFFFLDSICPKMLRHISFMSLYSNERLIDGKHVLLYQMLMHLHGWRWIWEWTVWGKCRK